MFYSFIMEIKIQSLHLKNKKNKLSYIWLINVFFEYSYMDFFNKQKKRLTPKQAKLRDRKSTRLNSSHVSTSYAVFCLKKKNNASTPQSKRPEHTPRIY